jgi:hypothetical protein
MLFSDEGAELFREMLTSSNRAKLRFRLVDWRSQAPDHLNSSVPESHYLRTSSCSE